MNRTLINDFTPKNSVKNKLTKKDVAVLSVFIIGSIVSIAYQQQVIADELAKQKAMQTLIPYEESIAGKLGMQYCYTNGTCGLPPNGQWNVITTKP